MFGGVAGVCEVAFTHPLDVCKTRLQAGIPLKFDIRSLYAGAVPRLTGVVPMRMVFWGSTFWLNAHLPIEDERRRALTAGALAGSAQTLIDGPIEVLKIRQIAGAEVGAAAAASATQATVRVGMFTGFGATLVRNVGFCMCLTLGTFAAPATLPAAVGPGLGALVGTIVTQPIDTIKTLQQSGQKVPRLSDMSTRFLFSGLGHRAGQGVVAMVIGAAVMRACERFVASDLLGHEEDLADADLLT